MESESKSRYLHHIDGIRAIAVTLVFLYHLKIPGFSGGYIGVDVFIVVSGYLISALITKELEQTGQFRFGIFYARRLRRLVPALTAMSLVFLMIGVLLFSPEMLIRIAREARAATLSFSNIQFWQESDYFDIASDLKPLLHTWSLGLEEQFYFFWPAMVLLAWRLAGRRGFAFITIVTAATSMGMNVACSTGVLVPSISWLSPLEDGPASTFFLLPFRAFEFALGALLVIPRSWEFQNNLLANLIALIGATLITIAVYSSAGSWSNPPWQSLVPCVGTSLLIAVGGQGVSGRLLSSRPFTWVGVRSYSIYLFHWPVIVIWAYVFGSMSMLGITAAVMATLILSTLCYTFVEQPFRSPTNPILRPVLSVIALLILTTTIILMNGWTFRITPPQGLAILGSATEFHRDYFGGRGFKPPKSGLISATDILLVGDSHGQQYAEGMTREIAEPEDLCLTVLAGTSCLHLPGFVRTSLGKDWQQLVDTGIDEILHHIAAVRVQPIVVMSHSWLNQMAKSKLSNSPSVQTATVLTPVDVAEGILALQSSGHIRWLVVIGQIPGAGRDDLYDELMRPRLSRKPVSEIGSSVATIATIEFNQILAKIAATTGKFIFINPTDVLCDGLICDNLDEEGRPLYSDSLQLSKFGSRYFVRQIKSQLLRLIHERERDLILHTESQIAR